METKDKSVGLVVEEVGRGMVHGALHISYRIVQQACCGQNFGKAGDLFKASTGTLMSNNNPAPGYETPTKWFVRGAETACDNWLITIPEDNAKLFLAAVAEYNEWYAAKQAVEAMPPVPVTLVWNTGFVVPTAIREPNNEEQYLCYESLEDYSVQTYCNYYAGDMLHVSKTDVPWGAKRWVFETKTASFAKAALALLQLAPKGTTVDSDGTVHPPPKA